jgi:hypothetical protein
MPHRRFLLGSLAYPLSSNISDVARVDYGRYGRINSDLLSLATRVSTILEFVTAHVQTVTR